MRLPPPLHLRRQEKNVLNWFQFYKFFAFCLDFAILVRRKLAGACIPDGEVFRRFLMDFSISKYLYKTGTYYAP